MTTRVLDRSDLDGLLSHLTAGGYDLIGPTVRDNAIVYDRIEGVSDLPEGWTDDQEAATYRIRHTDGAALFDYNTGSTGWKRFLYPSSEQLFSIERRNGSLVFTEAPMAVRRLALVGVRSCELAAIAIQDKVFTGAGHVDRRYQTRRRNVFILAVNCTRAGGTCFCASMGTGPRCTSGFDLALTELEGGSGHGYLIESGSPEGEMVLATLGGRAPTSADVQAADTAIDRAVVGMGRVMLTAGLPQLLIDNPEHPRWESIAARCLTCANCTMVCPTCFCSTNSDSGGLDGVAVRTRSWDSCFDLEFSGLHGHPVRSSPRSRYRQWMTHKLATWHDQFGSSGCVGCGRCITWCPVGIDITEEVAAMSNGGQS